jgi:two-component SAPR family response regulator
MHNVVMVIDDSRLELVLAENKIKKSRFAKEVITFNSPIDALEHLNKLAYDPDKLPNVIFLDIYMPLMNGFDFLDKFLEFSDDIKRRCKIVMFSSTNASEDHQRMKSYPVSKFLTKPLTKEMLENLSALHK